MSLLLALALGCGGKIGPDTFAEEFAIAYCEVLQECGDLKDMGMDSYDCQLSQEQSYDACGEDEFDSDAADDCVSDITNDLSCDDTNKPLESVIESCARVCP